MGYILYELPPPIEQRFSTNSWVDTDLPVLIGEINDIYTVYSGKTISNPDPLNTTNPIIESDYLKVIFLNSFLRNFIYIKNLGPANLNTTKTYSLY